MSTAWDSQHFVVSIIVSGQISGIADFWQLLSPWLSHVHWWLSTLCSPCSLRDSAMSTDQTGRAHRDETGRAHRDANGWVMSPRDETCGISNQHWHDELQAAEDRALDIGDIEEHGAEEDIEESSSGVACWRERAQKEEAAIGSTQRDTGGTDWPYSQRQSENIWGDGIVLPPPWDPTVSWKKKSPGSPHQNPGRDLHWMATAHGNSRSNSWWDCRWKWCKSNCITCPRTCHWVADRVQAAHSRSGPKGSGPGQGSISKASAEFPTLARISESGPKGSISKGSNSCPAWIMNRSFAWILRLPLKIVAWYIFGITMEIAWLHGIFFQYHTIVQYDLLPMHWLGRPAFVATLLLWKPCFFPACRLWKDGKDLLRWNGLAAYWRDGHRWFWPSGFGPQFPSLVLAFTPQYGKDTHTICSTRSGAPIISPSVPQGRGKSFKCGESLSPELVTKHIGKVWKGS